MLEGPHIVPAHLVAVHPDTVGTLVPEKDLSAIPEYLALALGHHVQPLAAAHVRLPDDIASCLGPAKPEHLLLQGESEDGATVRVELSPYPLYVAPFLHLEGAIQRLGGWLRVHVLRHGAVHHGDVLGQDYLSIAISDTFGQGLSKKISL